MADIKSAYGTSNQTITITIASLASAASRESTVIDNSSNKFLDAFVQVKVKANAAGTSATGYANVYVYSTADGGTTYADNCTGADAGVTLVSPTNLKLIGIVNVVANGVTYKSMPFSVAQAFGGKMPDRWGIVLQNNSGAALDATPGNHAAFYQGVFATST